MAVQPGGLPVLGLLIILFLSTFIQAHDAPNYQDLARRGEGRKLPKIAADDLSWRDDIVPGVGHQSPVEGHPVEPEHDNKTSVVTAPADMSLAPRGLHTFEPRQALRCDNGICADDSCCGKNGTCGYGGDFCNVEKGCQSNCKATAMCGKYSDGYDAELPDSDDNVGIMPCGMKLCCSAMGWCGTTEGYCKNADPVRNTLPCQAGYGACAMTGHPGCSKANSASNGRKIGYYQSWNLRQRKCNKMEPKDLDTTGYTHIFYAFGFIHPSTFEVVPAHVDDDELMKKFTALAVSEDDPDPEKKPLKTWLAIGGFDFSNNNTITHTTWSDMVATKERRNTFIKSLRAYMKHYGFSGVDLDWEYPGAPDRGGNKLEDTKNFAMLLREMRDNYKTEFGISLTLAPDYWYLRWFDAKGMQSSVDFFGFMAYDLHGSWDSDTKTLGRLVRGQADIREIKNDTIPLWFDGLDPLKINFGLALYGRGYTLADSKCGDLLCSFKGPSKPGPCTGQEGVRSRQEIQQLIRERRLKPKHLADSMMKQITWDDQWIGYDDEETFAEKTKWADSQCFGGTMVWSIDFQLRKDPDDGGEVVYLGPGVYSGEPAQCTAPCRFVLPPSALPSKTTISIPPYTTSIRDSSGSTHTVTITVPAITTDEINYYNVNVTSSQKSGYSFMAIPSVDVNPVTTTFTFGGTTQVRTLTLPPWPAITHGPGFEWNTTTPEDGDDGHIENPVFPPPVTTLPEWPSKTPFVDWNDDEPTGTWPEMEVRPLYSDVPDEGEDDDGDGQKHKTTCKLWFFWICINWGEIDIHIGGWEWNLPVGIWGPGPPDLTKIKLPPGFKFKGTLPPWPKITVKPGGAIEAPPKPSNCEPAKAELCITTTLFATSVSAGVTKTASSEVKSTCATITGCNVRDADATKTEMTCKFAEKTNVPREPRAKALEEAEIRREESTGEDSSPKEPHQEEIRDGEPQFHNTSDQKQKEKRDVQEPNWGCDSDPRDMVLFPANPLDGSERKTIINYLENRKKILGSDKGNYGESRSEVMGYTAYYYVYKLGSKAVDFFASDQVGEVGAVSKPPEVKTSIDRFNGDPRESDTVLPIKQRRRQRQKLKSLTERATDPPSSGSDRNWHLSQLSFPANKRWEYKGTVKNHKPDLDNPELGQFSWWLNDKMGEGQTIYVMDSGFGTPVPSDRDKEIDPSRWSDMARGPRDTYGSVPEEHTSTELHGAVVMRFAVGRSVGVAKKATVVQVPTHGPLAFIDQLLAIEDQIKSSNVVKKAVVSITFAWTGWLDDWVLKDFKEIMTRMENDLGVVFVASAGNSGKPVWRYPAMAQQWLKGMMVVGSTDIKGDRHSVSDIPGTGPESAVDVWAPGKLLPLPEGWLKSDISIWTAGISGTSFAAPQVAGLVAYFRSISSQSMDAEDIKKKVVSEMRRLKLSFTRKASQATIHSGDMKCPIKRSLAGRDDGDSCPFAPGSDGDPNTDNPEGPTIEYRPGEPGPICNENCGKLCEGWYCSPAPEGTPPDYDPPKETTTSTSQPPTQPTSTSKIPTKPSDPPKGEDRICYYGCISSPTGCTCSYNTAKEYCDAQLGCYPLSKEPGLHPPSE